MICYAMFYFRSYFYGVGSGSDASTNFLVVASHYVSLLCILCNMFSLFSFYHDLLFSFKHITSQTTAIITTAGAPRKVWSRERMQQHLEKMEQLTLEIERICRQLEEKKRAFREKRAKAEELKYTFHEEHSIKSLFILLYFEYLTMIFIYFVGDLRKQFDFFQRRVQELWILVTPSFLLQCRNFHSQL